MDETIVPDVALSQKHVELPEALREPTRSKSLLFLLLHTVANMVIGIANITVGSILLAEHISTLGYQDQTNIFSLLLGVGAVASVLTNPLVGMFSDRTTSRWGRRRPWLIAGGILTVIDLLLMSMAHSLLLLAIGYIVMCVGTNIIDQPLSTIVPDQVPIRQRATISGLSAGLGTIVGGIIGAILVAQYFTGIQAAYTGLAIAVAIMIGSFLLILRDVPLPRECVPPFHIKQILNAYWLNPIIHRDFALIWVARCLMFLAYTTVIGFMFYFLRDAVQYSHLFPGQTTAQGVQIFFTIQGLTIIVTSLVGGIISDKLQRRKPFVIASSLIIVVGLLLYAFFPIWPMIIVATVILGTGVGVYLAVDFALATQVLPAAANRGKDIGIIETSVFVPMIMSPIIAGVTLGVLHSYQALFLLLAIGTLIAAVLIVPIKSVR